MTKDLTLKQKFDCHIRNYIEKALAADPNIEVIDTEDYPRIKYRGVATIGGIILEINLDPIMEKLDNE